MDLLKSPGGDEENRTPDPLLARQVLSQLSYTPINSLLRLSPQGSQKMSLASFLGKRSNSEAFHFLLLATKILA